MLKLSLSENIDSILSEDDYMKYVIEMAFTKKKTYYALAINSLEGRLVVLLIDDSGSASTYDCKYFDFDRDSDIISWHHKVAYDPLEIFIAPDFVLDDPLFYEMLVDGSHDAMEKAKIYIETVSQSI